jgi:hypothetical protein
LAGLFGCNTFDAPIEESNGSRLVIPTDEKARLRGQQASARERWHAALVTKPGSPWRLDPERDAIASPGSPPERPRNHRARKR